MLSANAPLNYVQTKRQDSHQILLLLLLPVVAVCSFTGVDMRNMQCVLGTVLAGATRKVTVEVTADGKNFAADGTTTQAVLSNTAKLTCAGSSTAATQDPACDTTSKVDVTVSM